jgi:hypothetical protein
MTVVRVVGPTTEIGVTFLYPTHVGRAVGCHSCNALCLVSTQCLECELCAFNELHLQLCSGQLYNLSHVVENRNVLWKR